MIIGNIVVLSFAALILFIITELMENPYLFSLKAGGTALLTIILLAFYALFKYARDLFGRR